MSYLIDGHNLIPKIPGLSLNSMDDETQLIQWLQEFCRQTQKTVEVYFDNAPAGQVRTQRFGQVKAHFIRAGHTADQAIITRLQRLGRSARNWSVVSSDRQVAAAARELHASVISSDDFVRFLSIKNNELGSEVDADLALNSTEIDEWLGLFGVEGNDTQ